MKINVTVTKTSDGNADYIQIMSEDQMAINICLIAEKIEVVDHREPLKFEKEGTGILEEGKPTERELRAKAHFAIQTKEASK